MRAYVALAMLTALPLSITPAVAQEAGAQPDWIEQARMVAQMQGITVGEAVRRARLQEKVNRTVERFQNYPDYGGAWIEQDAGGYRANFAFRGGRKPSLGDTELQEVSSFSNATRSMSDLAQARASLARTLRQHGIKGAISVVQRTQRMELYPDQPDRLRELISQGTITIPDFVDVKDGPLVFRPEYDVYGAGSMNVQGPNGPAGNCNGGFVVTNGSVRGISTAGHCEDPGYDVVTHRDQPIGQFMGAVIYENGLDVAWHRNSTYNYLPRVRINATSYYTVTSVGPQIPAANTTVCIIKRNETQVCAYVLNHYYRLGDDGTYSDGPIIQTDRDLTVGGDSGSPWLYGGVAYGIHSGDNTYAGVVRNVYTPAASLPRMGISVVTQ